MSFEVLGENMPQGWKAPCWYSCSIDTSQTRYPLPNFGRNEDKLHWESTSGPLTLSSVFHAALTKPPMRNTLPIHCYCMGNVLPVRPTMEAWCSHLSCADDHQHQGLGGSWEGGGGAWKTRRGGIKEGSSVGAMSDGYNCGAQWAHWLWVEG